MTEDIQNVPIEKHNLGFGPRLLDSKEVASMLNVSEGWVRDHSNPNGPTPRLPCMKLGSGKTALIRFHLADVQQFIEDQREAGRQRSSARRWRN